ncbi:phosphoadenylyl-sulfate reductase [Segnochrobactrum spirostomi]|uniref:Adenosine 5'-phosphosulfate reductase n=1 Tax=Segnochrobactrum spirostomi TaxID=2608987 RepID=A0A6A7XXH7_9HYPH|nr:phosphoadenylyl-sulfate reductase [Segnochrobactrum spirostomi]MQT11350.1 phosphoadenylyl-sulfate reductase [Segnochrobactrum spirostomi]
MARVEPIIPAVAGPSPAALLAEDLEAAHGSGTAIEILEAALGSVLAGRIALVSSFGADSAVLLHLAATVDRDLPVIFLETGKHFPETLRYRDRLIERLGLTDVRSIAPDPARLAEIDPNGTLWFSQPDLCCRIRKVEPLARALAGFDGWISGRKRFQAATRAALPAFEADGFRVKVNPIARWSRADIDGYAALHDLPTHPLVEQGFRSIGCMPCTDKVADGEDERAGRWRGGAKTECGIHLGLVGREADGSGI